LADDATLVRPQMSVGYYGTKEQGHLEFPYMTRRHLDVLKEKNKFAYNLLIILINIPFLILTHIRYVPVTSKNLTQNGVVWLFGNSTLSSGVIDAHVPFNNLNYSISRFSEVCNLQKQVGMGKVVGVHFEQRPSF
jgi:hypothetical protein